MPKKPIHSADILLDSSDRRVYETERFDMAEEKEKLVKTSLYLEEEVIEALEETAKELEKETGIRWSKGAVVRLALSDFFTRRGRML